MPFLFILDVILALINIPGMIEGYWFSYVAFAFCIGCAAFVLSLDS